MVAVGLLLSDDRKRLHEKATTDELLREGLAAEKAALELTARIRRINELYQERLANVRTKP